MSLSNRSPQEKRDAMVAKVRQKLYRLVQMRGVSQRRIEQENDFTRGYMSQVLKGHITLTMRHVFGVLYVLDVEPAAFFDELFADDPEESSWLAVVKEKIVRYDAAMRQLEEQGVLTPVSASENAASDAVPADEKAQMVASGGEAPGGEEGE